MPHAPTQTFDVDQLNEAATAVWNTAYNRGHKDGNHDGALSVIIRQHESAAEVVGLLLSRASAELDADRQDDADLSAQIAVRLLSTTPLNRWISQTLGVLRSNRMSGRGSVTREQLQAAQRALAKREA